MPSRIYRIFAHAVANRLPLVCLYNGYQRHICPVILGHSGNQEKALVWQFGGETSEGPLRRADWKCFDLANVSDPTGGNGSWQSGLSHLQAQNCVKDVDYDANPASPYGPRNSLGRLDD